MEDESLTSKTKNSKGRRIGIFVREVWGDDYVSGGKRHGGLMIEPASDSISPVCLFFTSAGKQKAVVALLSRYRRNPLSVDGELALRVPWKLYKLFAKLEECEGDLRESELERILQSPSSETLEAVLSVRKLID